MEKVENVLKEFIKNLKEYINYLMKVDFKELFVNTVIIFCLIALASFVYIPISVVQELIRDFIQIFVVFNTVAFLIYNWIFKVVSFVIALYCFMLLFNMRFSDVKKNKMENKVVVKQNDKENKEVEMILPKTKK